MNRAEKRRQQKKKGATPPKSKSTAKQASNPAQKAASKKPARSGSFDFKAWFQEQWFEKSPILVFVLLFGAILGVFYAFWLTDAFRDGILDPWTRLNAVVGSGILNIFGQGTQAIGPDISSPDFAISVKQGCDAIEPTVLFIAGVVAFPGPWRKKLKGIPVGIAFLLGMNLIRIITLFLTGRYWNAAFEFMHIEVWQVIFIILALVAWGYWIRWALKSPTAKNPPSNELDSPAPA